MNRYEVDYACSMDPYVRYPSTSPSRPGWQFANRTSFHLASPPSGGSAPPLQVQLIASLPVFRDFEYDILIDQLSSKGSHRYKSSRLLMSEVGAVFFLPRAASLTWTGSPNSLYSSAYPSQLQTSD